MEEIHGHTKCLLFPFLLSTRPIGQRCVLRVCGFVRACVSVAAAVVAVVAVVLVVLTVVFNISYHPVGHLAKYFFDFHHFGGGGGSGGGGDGSDGGGGHGTVCFFSIEIL